MTIFERVALYAGNFILGLLLAKGLLFLNYWGGYHWHLWRHKYRELREEIRVVEAKHRRERRGCV